MTYLEEGEYFDYSNEIIQNLIQKIEQKVEENTQENFAVEAYNYIRDNWAYYPIRFSFIKEDWKASNIAQRSSGHCLDKAVILIAVLRGNNIPARLGLAKVKNHIAVEDILNKLGSDVLVPHGYVEIFLNNKWVKSTPAFNLALCEKLGVNPLEFDGKNDSLFQPYSSCGTIKFMEYLEDYGTFPDVPLAFMHELLLKTYPIFPKDELDYKKVYNLTDIK